MANLSIYDDQFERDDNTNISTSAPMGGSYTEVTSDFQIVSGKLKAIGLNAHLATVASPSMNSGDYYVQAIVYTNPSYASSIGLVGRYVDSSNYYYCYIGTVGQVLRLYKLVAGVATQLGTYSGGYTGGTSYTLKFSMSGTSLKVYVNGTERISTTDSAFSTGQPGFWTDYGNSTFDNFVISGDMTKPFSATIGTDYSQPALPDLVKGFRFNSIDQQVVTKSDGYNQGSTERNAEFDEVIYAGAQYVAFANPYENLTKYTNYVNGARAKGLKVFHRSHWNAWEGDNSIPVGLSRQDYLQDTYRFITENPTLFAAGDLFGMCVEPNRAEDASNYTFRTPETSGGTFDIAKYNTFCKDQVRYANQAFTDIGLGGTIYTFPISPSVSLLDLNGQSWTNTSGRTGGLNYNDIATYFGGYMSIDHYESDSIRSALEYYLPYYNDITKWALSFPGCQLFIGEFGYHTITSVSDLEQYEVFDKIIKDVYQKKNYIIGVNFWVQQGSNTASLWNDSSGSIIAGGRQAVQAIIDGFNTGPGPTVENLGLLSTGDQSRLEDLDINKSLKWRY